MLEQETIKNVYLEITRNLKTNQTASANHTILIEVAAILC